jgi:hypothetical protein
MIIEGRVIHHNDCTWCINRVVYKKVINRKNELERCGKSGRNIPHPREARRYCELYQQIGCDCNSCTTSV